MLAHGDQPCPSEIINLGAFAVPKQKTRRILGHFCCSLTSLGLGLACCWLADDDDGGVIVVMKYMWNSEHALFEVVWRALYIV